MWYSSLAPTSSTFPQGVASMVCPNEIQQEVEFLSERIQQLRLLQQSQKHLHFITVHLQEHIDKLQKRICELNSAQIAS
jgi:hypothetical protein